LIAASAGLIGSDWLKAFDNGAPPVEKLTFERAVLDGNGIQLKVRAGGSEDISIAQVQVDGAFWSFTQDPPGPLTRLSTAWLHIPYAWILGEKHAVKVLTKTGAAFTHEIEVAVATPKPHAGQLVPQAMLGAFVGIVPVVIGMLFYPAMRRMGGGALDFVLALTIGLLAFLLFDTLEDGIEIAGKAAAAFQGVVMVPIVALVSCLVLLVVGRRRGVPTGLALATYIALGIGLHNLGEGLAIGASFATGAAALASFLVVGFTLHNLTEGVGIAAPLLEVRPKLRVFAALAALAGLPAVLGTWVGAYAFAPHWAALCFGIAAGAILQVVVEVGAFLNRTARRADGTPLSGTAFAGFVAGLAVMYLTAMLVSF
jgi:zinc transporter ZupT